MSRVVKVASWLAGAFILVILVQYPIQKSTSSWESWSLPLSGKVIVLDPGHGGVDGGAVGADGTLEKDIALDVTNMLRDYLQQAGALVYLTREVDQDLAAEGTKGLSRRKSEDLKNRLEFIKDKNPDFFISVHLNALPSKKWSGAQTFYYPSLEHSELLAKKLQAEIKRNLENTNREALALNGMFLLKHAGLPGVLVEIGFLSNAHERELLKTEEYQRKMAASIYEGILRYQTEDVE
ncbi:N-acetylmuramoyl-L-alanine amidase CwlD [Aquibacillus koreensis]|uniref:N-acetylmuramoyl-L-alanine amidase CwlD n=1 Tax=Aquibacillus koreensis TaxID=279446 RepID=A0A9X4AJY2_9BACI|nr:N-acetylmuramoyl-L-alanine amidase CwlD [Aquibacillus koreensis]MCT2536566.1 N-acetylmuramoyl-L-alanine amidase CwlD [Aquibacillus koreensis]MDC3422486.1 N-acetylmuramoyl-L-alanine amidase CwlD [Aquibacillus koreensis]